MSDQTLLALTPHLPSRSERRWSAQTRRIKAAAHSWHGLSSGHQIAVLKSAGQTKHASCVGPVRSILDLRETDFPYLIPLLPPCFQTAHNLRRSSRSQIWHVGKADSYTSDIGKGANRHADLHLAHR